MVKETLAEIDAQTATHNFNCAIVLWGDKVIEAAPIVKYMKGWHRDRVRAYCASKGWNVSVVTVTERPDGKTA